MNPPNWELDILRLRYVDKLTWAQVGEELGFSRRKIYAIRTRPEYVKTFDKVNKLIWEAFEKEKQRRNENV